jgi:glycosyltransferase involved in cell wall biosynthesis
MKLLIATDAWTPQVNGVVRTLEATTAMMTRRGVSSVIVEPGMFPTVGLPTYPDIRLAMARAGRLREIIADERPDAVHAATEGPVGWAARKAAVAAGLRFTTSYHTRFPEYVAARAPVPLALTYRLIRRFHNPADAVMVATETLRRELAGRGFRNLVLWARGVDAQRFRPRAESVLDLPRPIFLMVTRVAVEKNIEAFLDLDLPGSKVIVGDGPQADELKTRYPRAHFTGVKAGEELARIYASCDVFVFPSRTDTCFWRRPPRDCRSPPIRCPARVMFSQAPARRPSTKICARPACAR